MKTILYICAFMLVANLNAQEKSKNMSETTEVKTVKVNNGKEVVEKKVKVTTKKEKEVALDKADAGKVNQDMVVGKNQKVTKIIEIDNDNDPFYDSEMEIVTYVKDGEEFSFVKNTEGFSVSAKGTKKPYGNAVRSSLDDRYYIFNNKDYSGVGYFDNNGNFVVEYYNNETNSLITTKYVTITSSK